MDVGELDLDLGRRHIERAKAGRSRLGQPLARLGARGTLPKAPGLHQQPVVVKVDTPGAGAKGIRPRYLQHEKGREGLDALLYGPGSQDGQAFHRSIREDTHRFTLYVSFFEQGGVDRQRFIEAYMGRVEQDLGTKLAWLAANHYDRPHPHTHIVIRAITDTGAPLYMKKSYYTHGLRERASELLTQLVGRTQTQDRVQEWQRALSRDEQQHMTSHTLFEREVGRLNGVIVAARDPDMEVQRRAQQLYGHEGMAAHVDRLWERVQAQEQQRQHQGRGY